MRYISRYTSVITIAESSGKPMPTPVSFRVAGYDRIAKYYGAKLVALELRPVVRYMLPKAEVMKEVYLPDTLDAAVRKEAFYISVPKMKTNLTPASRSASKTRWARYRTFCGNAITAT